MGQAVKDLDQYLADFARWEKDGGETVPSWVHEKRRAAITQFAALGFPTARHENVSLREEWKYTSVTPITKTSFTRATSTHNGTRHYVTADQLAPFTLQKTACAQLVFINGAYAPELSSVNALPKGVEAGSLAAALRKEPALLETHLGRYASYQEQPFVALNTAFMTDGGFVYVAPGAVVTAPIHLLFISTAQPQIDQAIAVHPRNLIVAETESQATIIESYIGLDDAVSFTNAVSEIHVGDNAVVHHYKRAVERREAFHVATLQACLERHSTFGSHCLSLGGALVRNDINAMFRGEGGECTLDGLYMVSGRQHVDTHTRVDHVKPHCRSRELYKGILDGHARGVFNGKVYVHKDAQKTDAQQTNKNLLLSEDAVINTKPQLEIYADDVKCMHGSTVGQLDSDALFYLRSRGLDATAARSVLTRAFAGEMTSRIPVTPLREQIETLLATTLQ